MVWLLCGHLYKRACCGGLHVLRKDPCGVMQKQFAHLFVKRKYFSCFYACIHAGHIPPVPNISSRPRSHPAPLTTHQSAHEQQPPAWLVACPVVQLHQRQHELPCLPLLSTLCNAQVRPDVSAATSWFRRSALVSESQTIMRQSYTYTTAATHRAVQAHNSSMSRADTDLRSSTACVTASWTHKGMSCTCAATMRNTRV